MLSDDLNLTAHDVQAIDGRDALARFFAKLGYNTDKRRALTPDALGITQPALRAALKHVERVAANGGLQVFLFEVGSVTLAHRRAVTALLNNRDGDFLFVLTTPDYERLDFALVEREETDDGGKAVRARPLAISVERRKPTHEGLRTLRRMTFTCVDDLGQLEKLLSAFRIAQWSEPRFNNVALFSDHYLKHRLPDEPEWKDADAAKAAFKAMRAIGDRNKDAQAKTVADVVLPVLKALGHDPRPAKAADSGPMERLSEHVVCFAYHWLRALDTKDESDPERPDDIPAMRVISEFERSKAQWAILTNGKQWRLYCARAHGRHANFYEVDFRETLATQEADGEAFRYFWLMFRAQAFAPGFTPDGQPGPGFLDRVFEGSRVYARELGERLKSRVFEEVFPHFAEGFIAHIRAAEGKDVDLSDERLNDVFRATLTLLYRLIFLLYAESLDLLPVAEANYREVSLRSLCDELAERAGANEAQAGEKLRKAYSPSETALYDRLIELFRVVDQGDNRVNVPRYNGGLFITEPETGDDSDEANAARFLARYKVPDRFLALALDRLARDEDPKRHELVPVDYKSLGVRQLGSIYEGLLEFKVRVAAERVAIVKGKKSEEIVSAREAEKESRKIVTRSKMHGADGGFLRKGAVYLENDKHERKATGSYYTPDYIVKYIVENTVGPVLEEKFDALRDDFRHAEVEYQAAKRKDAELKKRGLSDDPDKVADVYAGLVDRLFTLRVLDPAMGSGHFLVEAVDFITDRMLAFLNGFAWNPVQAHIRRARREIQDALHKAGVDIDERKLTDINLLKRHVLKRCIFGVDLNPMAVELAKVSLWLDCFTLGAPLSFLDHHLKCGNSLIGVTVEEVEKTLKKSAGLFSNRFAGLMLATDIARQIAALPDATAEQAAHSRAEHRRACGALAPFKRMLDIYTSQWFGNGAEKAKGRGRSKESPIIPAIEWLGSGAAAELFSADADGAIAEEGKAISRGSKKEPNALFNPDGQKRILDRKSRPPEIAVHGKADPSDSGLGRVPLIAAAAAAEHRFFHWELEFPEVFYAPTTPRGQNIRRGEGAGFDAVIGNPPYSVSLQTDEKSFWNHRFREVSSPLNLAALFIKQAHTMLAGRSFFGVIVPKSLVYSSGWSQLFDAVLPRIHSIVDVSEAFDDVLLEQVIITAGCDPVDSYASTNASGLEQSVFVSLPKSLRAKLPVLPCGHTEAEVELALNMVASTTPLASFVNVYRGLPAQRHCNGSSGVPVIAGKSIARFAIREEHLRHLPRSILAQLPGSGRLKHPKIVAQNIVAHITRPFPHIALTAAFDADGLLCLDTVNVVEVANGRPWEQILAVLNSRLSSWFAYNFIYGRAVRTMHFDTDYVGQLRMPSVPEADAKYLTEIVHALLSKPDKGAGDCEIELEKILARAMGISFALLDKVVQITSLVSDSSSTT